MTITVFSLTSNPVGSTDTEVLLGPFHFQNIYQTRVHIFTIQSYALVAIKLILIENSLYYISMISINEI